MTFCGRPIFGPSVLSPFATTGVFMNTLLSSVIHQLMNLFLSLVSLLSLEEKGLLKRANFSSIVRVGHISVSFANTVAPLLPLLCARCIILAVGWLFSKSNFVSFVCFGKLVKIDRYQLSKLWKQNCFSVEAFSTKI